MCFKGFQMLSKFSSCFMLANSFRCCFQGILLFTWCSKVGGCFSWWSTVFLKNPRGPCKKNLEESSKTMMETIKTYNLAIMRPCCSHRRKALMPTLFFCTHLAPVARYRLSKSKVIFTMFIVRPAVPIIMSPPVPVMMSQPVPV